jgi:hypothetical protein
VSLLLVADQRVDCGCHDDCACWLPTGHHVITISSGRIKNSPVITNSTNLSRIEIKDIRTRLSRAIKTDQVSH